VIDADRLASSPQYRAALERDVTERTALEVDFGSARSARTAREPAVKGVDIDAAHATALAFCESLGTAVSNPRVAAAARTACEKLCSSPFARG